MRTIGMLTAILSLAACGGAGEATGPAGPPPESSVFEPMTDTLDRAAGVEDTLRDAAAERRRQLEAEE